MSDDNKEHIAEIRGRLAKAKPGPWEWEELAQHDDGGKIACLQTVRAQRPIVLHDARWSPEAGDAALIANAPTDLAFVLDLLEGKQEPDATALKILSPRQQLNETERALRSLSQLAMHSWTLRGTAGAFLSDEESGAIDEALEVLQAARARLQGARR